MKIHIDPEFCKLIPPMSADEAAQLEANLVAEKGARDPLVLWGSTLIDGHHRYDICTRLKLAYATTTVELKDRDAAKVWIIENQFGRRNLSKAIRIELAMKLEPLYAERAKENQQKAGGAVVQKSAQAGSANERKTRAQVAKLAGVSHDTYAKGKKLLQEAPEEVKEQLRSGKVSINKAYQKLAPVKERSELPNQPYAVWIYYCQFVGEAKELSPQKFVKSVKPKQRKGYKTSLTTGLQWLEKAIALLED